MPSRDESRLLALARAQAQNREAEAELPDIDPSLLLSPAGRSELEAAQYASRTIEATVEIRTGEPNANGDIFSEEALQQIMMSTVSEDLGEDFGAVPFPAPEEIEFDTEGLIEGATAPNERARFQIGRQSPPHRPFGHPNASGMDGVVVSQRGSDGRFQASVRVPRGSTLHRAIEEGRVHNYSMSGSSGDIRVRSGTAPVPTESTTIKAVQGGRPAPTVWERLNGPDPFDD